MSDYTPTTEQVRIAYGLTFDTDAEFDRWLAARDREVAARALREFAKKCDPHQLDTVLVWGTVFRVGLREGWRSAAEAALRCAEAFERGEDV